MSVDTSLARMDAELHIAGAWTAGEAGYLDNIDPGTGKPVGALSLATVGQVSLAIEAAANAFGAWSNLLPSERGAIITRSAQLLADRAEEAVATMLSETGKTESDARGEIARAIFNLRWNGEQAARIQATGYPGLAVGSRRMSIPTPLARVSGIS